MTDPHRVVFLFGLAGVLLSPAAVGTVGAQTAPDCSTVSYNGDGTEANPYEVENVDQLQCIEEQGLDTNYVQVSDIDASGTSGWNGGGGFEPIGGALTNSFEGTFDGADHTISGLTIDRGSTNSVGLFGVVGSGGRLESASLENGDVSGSQEVGGLVGRNEGTVNGSYATGDAFGNDNVGGLVGDNDGTVHESYATGGVSVSGSSVGGLVGDNEGTVTESYANGSVSGFTDVGGLAGFNAGNVTESYANGSVSGNNLVGGLVARNSGGTVRESYATGSVSGVNNDIGGLVGANSLSGTVRKSYATGTVTGNNRVGGLTGQNFATIRESYATGDVSGNDDVGGLVGVNVLDGTVINSYWDTETTGRPTSDGGTELTTSEMTGSTAPGNMTGFDFTSTWETVTNPDDYPILAFQSEDSGNGGGRLSSDNPFGDSNNNPVDRSTVIDRVVEWNLNGEINGTPFTRSEIINFVVEWNLAS
jgi:hypothetical protein